MACFRQLTANFRSARHPPTMDSHPQEDALPLHEMYLISFTCLSLLQFCVLGFGLFQDGDVRIGVFPENEELLVANPTPNSGCRSLRPAEFQLRRDFPDHT